MTGKFLVYELLDPRYHDVFYIGISCSEFISEDDDPRKQVKILLIRLANLEPILNTLIKNLSKSEAIDYVYDKIAERKSNNLSNVMTNIKKFPTQKRESREKNRKKHLGRKFSEEHKRKLSLAKRKKRKPLSEATKRKLSLALKKA